MTLHDILENWEDISSKKKMYALSKVYDHIANLSDEPWDELDDVVHDILTQAAMYESMDFFGTEGLKV